MPQMIDTAEFCGDIQLAVSRFSPPETALKMDHADVGFEIFSVTLTTSKQVDPT